MRITTKMTASNAVYNINLGMTKLDRLNEQISANQRVLRPSDDPSATRKILGIENQVKATTQYVNNSKNGIMWSNMAGTALQGMINTISNIRSAAASSNTGLYDPGSLANTASSINMLKEQLIDYANTSLDGSYIFAGFNNSSRPFSTNSVSGDLTLGSTTISNISTTDLYVGMPITGDGIPADTTITAIATSTVSGDTVKDNAVMTNIDTTNLAVGMSVTGPGIPDNTVIAEITLPKGAGGSLTLSANATANGAGITVTYPNPNGPVTISKAATQTLAGNSITFSGKFNGADDAINIEIDKGVEATINVTAGSFLRGGTPPGTEGSVDIIKAIDKLMADVAAGNSTGIQAANALLEKGSRQLLATVSDIAMRKVRFENAQASQEKNNSVYLGMLSDEQYVDMAANITALNQQKTAYEATLQSTAKIVPLSLLDYL